MPKPSKENNILKLFFNAPLKNWHFSEIKKVVPIADNKISRWLKIFESRGFIKRIKEKGRMPYYISLYEQFPYQNRKKLFAQNMFYESGLLDYLMSLRNIKTIIIFGSFVRSDWYGGSDIDLFICGDVNNISLLKFEKVLNREIQLFSCNNIRELRKFPEKLLRNVIKGFVIKGNIDFIEVKINENYQFT